MGMQKLSNEQKQRAIETLLNTRQGRERIATSLQQPIRIDRDYTSVARRTFYVENIPDGAEAKYDKDIDVPAYVVSDEGESITKIIRGRRIVIPTFDISVTPTVGLSELRSRRFDLLDRIQERAKSGIQLREDTCAFNIMDAVATSGFDNIAGGANPDQTVVAPLTPSVFADAFGMVESRNLRVARIFMNPRDYTDLRKWDANILGQETSGVLIKSGLLAILWNAEVIVSSAVAAGVVYICCEPMYFGRIPVRCELTVLPADDNRTRTIGYSIFETIGIGCTNPYGLVRLLVTR